MTKVPEAITARLQEIESNLSSARQIQQMDAAQVARLEQQAVELRSAIAGRRRAICGWKLQRDALRYAVDAIEGRVIHLGTVEAPIEPVAIERVVALRQRRPKKSGQQRRSGEPRPTPAKDAVYEMIKRIGPATPAEITAEVGLAPRAVAAVLGRLATQGLAKRTDGGLWGPAHQ